MTQRFGYYVDLSTIELSEDGPTWIQAMPLGEYDHPFFGKIKISPDRVRRFADNVNTNVRGTELDIDYDHKTHSGEAAGWVKAADARPNGLALLVDWTPKARQAIRERAYKYFSPEFTDEWKHPKTGQVHKDVLFGGGITNRPFLKDIAPINASELVLGDQESPNTGGRMDPKQLRKALRLPEDASDEQVNSAVDTLAQANEGAGPPGGTGPASDQQQAQNPPSGEQGVNNGGTNANQLSELAATNPLVKTLMEQQEAMRRQLAEQARSLRLSEMQNRVSQLGETATGKGFAFPAVVLNELPNTLTDMSDTVSKKVLELFEKLGQTGMVKLGETGSNRSPERGETGNGQDAVHKAVVALMDKDKDLSYTDAFDKVLSEKPELFESYRETAYAGRES